MEIMQQKTTKTNKTYSQKSHIIHPNMITLVTGVMPSASSLH